jgi:hypothetical protein
MTESFGKKISKVFMGDFSQVVVTLGSPVLLQFKYEDGSTFGNLVPLSQQGVKQCPHFACNVNLD